MGVNRIAMKKLFLFQSKDWLIFDELEI